MSKSCFWMFFENVNAEGYIQKLENIEQTEENITYICGQLEQGTHLHAQCYIQLRVSKPLSWLKRVVSPTASFAIQHKKASAQNGRHYCSKPHEGCDCKECLLERENPTALPNTFVEYGTIRDKGSGAGMRNDIKALYDKTMTHCKEREIMADENVMLTYANYPKFYERVRMLNRPPDLESVEVKLFVGDPGTGKTRKAFNIREDYYDVPINNGTIWFDGYDQNDVIVFDDFAGRADHTTLVSCLKLFDRYARRVPVKGTMTWLRSPIVVVTTNIHPRGWYDWKEREKSYVAITRRFTSVTVFTGEPDEVSVEEEFDTPGRVREYFNDRDRWPLEYDRIAQHNNNHYYN